MTVSMQVWDTAGQERYQSLGQAFYRGADACILVYDITNAASFEHLVAWRQNFLDKAVTKNPQTFPFFVFGNKLDRGNERQVRIDTAKEWAKKNNNLPWQETSALDSHCIEKAFNKIANEMLKKSLNANNQKYVKLKLTQFR